MLEKRSRPDRGRRRSRGGGGGRPGVSWGRKKEVVTGSDRGDGKVVMEITTVKQTTVIRPHHQDCDEWATIRCSSGGEKEMWWR